MNSLDKPKYDLGGEIIALENNLKAQMLFRLQDSNSTVI